MQELNESTPDMNVKEAAQKGTLKALIEEILKEHHEPTRSWLDKLETFFSAAARAVPDRKNIDKLGMAFRSMAMTMHMHMEKEEQVLFPMFQRLEDGFNTNKFCGGIENPVHVMENEHKELDFHFERFRRITNNYEVPSDLPGGAELRQLYDGLLTLEADLKIHSEKEECRLFPAAIALEKLQTNKPANG